MKKLYKIRAMTIELDETGYGIIISCGPFEVNLAGATAAELAMAIRNLIDVDLKDKD